MNVLIEFENENGRLRLIETRLIPVRKPAQSRKIFQIEVAPFDSDNWAVASEWNRRTKTGHYKQFRDMVKALNTGTKIQEFIRTNRTGSYYSRQMGYTERTYQQMQDEKIKV